MQAAGGKQGDLHLCSRLGFCILSRLLNDVKTTVHVGLCVKWGYDPADVKILMIRVLAADSILHTFVCFELKRIFL